MGEDKAKQREGNPTVDNERIRTNGWRGQKKARKKVR